MKKFDGEISFESVPGKGSNFTYSMKLYTNTEMENMNNSMGRSASEILLQSRLYQQGVEVRKQGSNSNSNRVSASKMLRGSTNSGGGGAVGSTSLPGGGGINNSNNVKSLT